MNCFESFEYAEKRIASIHKNFLPSLAFIGFLHRPFSTVECSLGYKHYLCCEATTTKRAVASVGSVQPECIVPLSTWSFLNFKPKFLLNGKRPWFTSKGGPFLFETFPVQGCRTDPLSFGQKPENLARLVQNTPLDQSARVFSYLIVHRQRFRIKSSISLRRQLETEKGAL